jgi:hypothetical protein
MAFYFRCFCLFVALSAAVVSPVRAQGFESMMNTIIRGTPGVTNVTVGAGINATVAGTVTVAGANVASTATAGVTAAAIARGAARVAVRAVPWVGAAVTVATIANMVSESGIRVCPPPDFFCKPDPKGPDPSDIYGYYVQPYSAYKCNKIADHCGYMEAASQWCTANKYSNWDGLVRPYQSNPYPQYSASSKTYTFYFQCLAVGDSLHTVTMSAQTTCPAGFHVDAGQCVRDDASVPVLPVSETELNTQILSKLNSNASLMASMKSQLDSLVVANPGVETPIDYSKVPVTIVAPKTVGPETLVSTRVIPNADGSTSTETVTEQVVVNPVIGSNGTVTNPNISFPYQTVTTITNVNNVTNVRNITTETRNNPAPPIRLDPPKTDFPDDYNREVTQKAILSAVSGEGMPDAKLDTKTEEADLDKANKDALAAVGTIAEGSIGITNWFPKIQTAACRNPQVPNPIGGAMVDVVICDKVDMFSAFISGVLAVFCLYGCVREVTVAVKA